tara:strand:+ start:871 stop:1566 length:696 start_codon:yes stop_codon:yes gene_type:complete
VDKKESLSFHFRELEAKMRSVVLLLILSVVGFSILSLDIMNSILQITGMEKEDMAAYAPTELIVSRLKLSIILAIATSLPLLAVRLYQFTKPGLKEQEKKWILFTIPISMIAFVAGSIFGYAIILPETIDLMIAEESKISISGFFDFTFFIIFGIGFALQIPTIILANRIFDMWKKEELEERKIYIYMAIFGLTFLISPEKSLIIQLMLGIIFIFIFKITLKIDSILRFKN